MYVGLCSAAWDWTAHTTHMDSVKGAWTYEANGALHANGRRAFARPRADAAHAGDQDGEFF